MMNKKNKYLLIDTYNGKSKWLTEDVFKTYIFGDEYDGKDSKGYYYEYVNDDGEVEKEYYNWRDNWDEIKKTPTHTLYKGEEHIILDFTNHKVGGAWLKEAK